jgi:hypothetical protein
MKLDMDDPNLYYQAGDADHLSNSQLESEIEDL